MKVTMKGVAIFWALLLACLWLPHVALAGFCQDSQICCASDDDCAVGESCSVEFGVCESGGQLCEADADCGAHCAVRIGVDCTADPNICEAMACTEIPRIECTQDAHCWEGGGTCEPNPCTADEACIKDPAATGVCENIAHSGSYDPCATDGDCPEGEYCVLPGECTTSTTYCGAGIPTGTCSGGGFAGERCTADGQCASCVGGTKDGESCVNDGDCRVCSEDGEECTTTGDCLNKVCSESPYNYCFDNGDCSAGTCVTQTCSTELCDTAPICLAAGVPNGLCDDSAPICQDDGDCDGGTCVITGLKCTVGTCNGGPVPVCAVDEDCGEVCGSGGTNPGASCTTAEDCGRVCAGGDRDTLACSGDVDCVLRCSATGGLCDSDADCRHVCYENGEVTDPEAACPSAAYCVSTGACESAETCACDLAPMEACVASGDCVLGNSCDPAYVCNTDKVCNNVQKQVCTNNLLADCDADSDCNGCSLDPWTSTCSTDGDCPNRCSLQDPETACVVDGDCQNVCSGDHSITCTSDGQCLGTAPCLPQTCLDNECAGTCEPVFWCKNDTTGACSNQRCTVPSQEWRCAEGYSCTGDFDCCSGTCVPNPASVQPDPQCADGDCHACYVLGPDCTDADGDTYAVEGGDCGVPPDCNDGNAAVNPGATESYTVPATCADGLDNDCNGVADELDPKCIPPTPCSASASASTGGTASGAGSSAWYLLLLAGVVLIGVSAKRAFGHKKE